ncbi:MAG: copper homeostasis protein CutC, partial [Planctomycetota bacterium]|nr:copper homeostasis protein CutC [Planctomycetota bacterium]
MNAADIGARKDDPRSLDRIKIEVCIASVADAVAAERAGADRLELNQAIELGGLTPPVALL